MKTVRDTEEDVQMGLSVKKRIQLKVLDMTRDELFNTGSHNLK